MCAEVEKLEFRINQMRKSLILIVEETGLNSDDTICYSQKLDELISRYQKLKMSNTQKIDPTSNIATG
jgi:stage 0 sporulation regulatory protein